MNEDPTQLGRWLANAVPPLPEPADRLAQVRARVRRSRLRTGGTVGLASFAAGVLLTLAVPSVLAGPGDPETVPGLGTAAQDTEEPGTAGLGDAGESSPRPDSAPAPNADAPDRAAPDPDPEPAGGEPTTGSQWDGDDCPPKDELQQRPSEVVPQEGTLVPTGAVAILHCQRGVFVNQDGDLVWHLLTTSVDRVVTALRELRTEEEVLAETEQSQILCTARGYSTTHALLVAYPDGSTVTVVFEANCSSWTRGNQIRYEGDTDVLDLFNRLYLRQPG